MHQQLSSNRNSIEVLLDTNLVRANAVDDAGAELLRARLVMLAAQTALLEGKSIDNLASMQRLDGYLKKSADLIDSVRKTPETSPVGKRCSRPRWPPMTSTSATPSRPWSPPSAPARRRRPAS